MTNTALFDLLGQIDSKFYDEVLGGDPEKPMKIKISNSRSNPLLITAIAAAACLVIGVGAALAIHISNQTGINKIVQPNTSEYYGDFSAADIASCREQILAEFPELEIYEADGGTLALQTRAMDINCDGEDEAVLFSKPKEMLFVFVKADDTMQLTDTADLPSSVYCMDSLYDLHRYDGDGESFWYYGVHFGSGTDDNELSAMARLGTENGGLTVDFPLAYGHFMGKKYGYYDELKLFYKTDWDCTETFRDVSGLELISDLTREEFEAVWSKYDGLPEFRFDFELEYPFLTESSWIPAVNDPSEMDNAVKKARINGIPYDNEYTIWLLGENVFQQADYSEGYIFMTDMYLALTKDGKIVSKERIVLDNDYTSVKDGKYIQSYIGGGNFSLYELKDTKIIVYEDKYGFESNFFAVKDNKLILLKGLTTPGSSDIGHNAHASNGLMAMGNSLIDPYKDPYKDSARTTDFYPEAFDKDPNIAPHFAVRVTESDDFSIDKYKPYDPSSDEMMSQALISEKQCGDYTVKLLGHNVQTIHDEYPHTRYSDLFIALETVSGEVSGKKLMSMTSRQDDLDAGRLDDYLFTFEMKNGTGCGIYAPFGYGSSELAFRYVWLYLIEDNSFVEFKDAFNAPTNEGSLIEGFSNGYKIVPDENRISFPDGNYITLSFRNKVYYNGEAPKEVYGGKRYATGTEPTFEVNDVVCGTEAEWKRWQDIIGSGKIYHIDGADWDTGIDMSITNFGATHIVDMFSKAQMRLFDELGNPATGGSYTVYAYDENADLLFCIVYDEYWLQVRFADDANSYVFNGEDCGLDKLGSWIIS